MKYLKAFLIHLIFPVPLVYTLHPEWRQRGSSSYSAATMASPDLAWASRSGKRPTVASTMPPQCPWPMQEDGAMPSRALFRPHRPPPLLPRWRTAMDPGPASSRHWSPWWRRRCTLTWMPSTTCQPANPWIWSSGSCPWPCNWASTEVKASYLRSPAIAWSKIWLDKIASGKYLKLAKSYGHIRFIYVFTISGYSLTNRWQEGKLSSL